MPPAPPRTGPPASLRASRALAHPLWWVALALLVANDHLFKGAGVLPAGLTGKLSDFAGLLVAPVVLAALFAVRERRGWLASHLAVGIGFAAINLSPAIARAVEAATLPTPFPWWITVDPTDLIALPMLAVSAAVFGAWCRRPVALRPTFGRLGLALGGVACVATSPPPEEMPPGEFPPGTTFSSAWARVALVNTTDATIVLRTRSLRDSVRIDCDRVAADPTAHLTPELFGAPTLWSLEPGTMLHNTEFDNQSRRGCRVALLSTAGRTRLLFAIDRDLPEIELRYEVGTTVDSDPRLIALTATEAGARLDAHPTLFAPPRDASADLEATCAAVEPGAGLAWTVPPAERGLLVGHSVGPDGCHALDIEHGDGEDGAEAPEIGRWYVCAPGAPLDLPLGSDIQLSASIDGAHSELLIQTPTRAVRLVRTTTAQALTGLSVEQPTADDACRAAWRDSCGGFMSPLVVRDVEGPLPLGEPVRTGDDTLTTVIRAQEASVADAECDPWGATGPRLELVIETRTADDAPIAPEQAE